MALGLDHGPRTRRPADAADPAARYRAVRDQTMTLAAPLEPEDFVVQSMPDASPAKWHLAHTTWFFETFLLAPATPGYRAFDEQFSYLFNSYYNAVGERIRRDRRGLISRPSIAEVFRYRAAVDAAMLDLLDRPGGLGDHLAATVEIGLHHEQQHQELFLTDIKHALAGNPLRPAYRRRPAAEPDATAPAEPLTWVDRPAGICVIGHDGAGFAFDNEGPRHRQFVEAHRVASRPATNADYLDFIEAGGYRRPEFWLSDGWESCRSQGWEAPLYWERRGGDWWSMTLSGMRPIAAAEPVVHVSYYEADAFARWSAARLPTEAEWESVAADAEVAGNFVESGAYHPAPSPPGCPSALFGDVWEWTASPYTAYPGFRAAEGALGEYNGKFMCNQMILRGGSCASPASHLRATYRNFFGPASRWQFTGVRLARDIR